MKYEDAQKWFKYEAASGNLLWNHAKPGVRRGMKAGFMLNGTKYVTVDWQREQVKNIVWLLNTGSWPTRRLYHQNGNRADTRFDNLGFSKNKTTTSSNCIELVLTDGRNRAVYFGGAKIAEGDPDKVLEVVKALLVY